MIRIDYRAASEQRRALVRAISEILSANAVYLGAPSFAYHIDGYIISQYGMVTCSDKVLRQDIAQLILGLREYGFVPVHIEDDSVDFSVTISKDGFSEAALANMHKIIASKAALLKRALKTDTLEVIETSDKLCFPWFRLQGLTGEGDAYTKLITGICNMAKRQKRVTAHERNITNDKFTMRVFLLRLGFIGKEYKVARRILLHNLTGNGSWLTEPQNRCLSQNTTMHLK